MQHIRLIKPTMLGGTMRSPGVIQVTALDAEALLRTKRAVPVDVRHNDEERRAAQRAAIPDEVILAEAVRRGFMEEPDTKTKRAMLKGARRIRRS